MNTCKCVLLSIKEARLNNCEFDLEGGFVGVPRTCYLSGQSFITPWKLVGELGMLAMNN